MRGKGLEVGRAELAVEAFVSRVVEVDAGGAVENIHSFTFCTILLRPASRPQTLQFMDSFHMMGQALMLFKLFITKIAFVICVLMQFHVTRETVLDVGFEIAHLALEFMLAIRKLFL